MNWRMGSGNATYFDFDECNLVLIVYFRPYSVAPVGERSIKHR